MKKIIMWGALVLINAMGIGTAQACSIPRFPLIGNPALGAMTVQSGQPCTIYFSSPGPTRDVQILLRPKQGTVATGDVHTVIYRSRPGFVGNDSFTYSYSGHNSVNRPLKIRVQIAVTVTP